MNQVHSKQKTLSRTHRIARDERGLSTVEYTILLVLIAVVGIKLWTDFGGTLQSHIQQADSDLQGMGKTAK